MKRHLIASGLAVLLAGMVPTLSQAQQDVNTTRADRDGGTDGEWGLLGLLGLAGLAGLRRRDHREDVTHRPTHAASR